MSLLHTLKSLFKATPRTTPAAAFDRVRAGRAVLVDVREPGEWSGGVAEGAVLLPLTDLTGSRRRWRKPPKCLEWVPENPEKGLRAGRRGRAAAAVQRRCMSSAKENPGLVRAGIGTND